MDSRNPYLTVQKDRVTRRKSIQRRAWWKYIKKWNWGRARVQTTTCLILKKCNNPIFATQIQLSSTRMQLYHYWTYCKVYYTLVYSNSCIQMTIVCEAACNYTYYMYVWLCSSYVGFSISYMYVGLIYISHVGFSRGTYVTTMCCLLCRTYYLLIITYYVHIIT